MRDVGRKYYGNDSGQTFADACQQGPPEANPYPLGHWAKDVVDLANLCLVLQEDRSVEVTAMMITGIQLAFRKEVRERTSRFRARYAV